MIDDQRSICRVGIKYSSARYKNTLINAHQVIKNQ